jgi:hypothetical protein
MDEKDQEMQRFREHCRFHDLTDHLGGENHISASQRAMAATQHPDREEAAQPGRPGWPHQSHLAPTLCGRQAAMPARNDHRRPKREQRRKNARISPRWRRGRRTAREAASRPHQRVTVTAGGLSHLPSNSLLNFRSLMFDALFSL